VRFGDRRLDVRYAPAANTREVMVGPRVGVEAVSWPGQLTEQPSVDKQPEVPVDGRQAHPWRSAEDQSVDFLGRRMRLEAPDHLEHRAARNGQAESVTTQCDISTLDARRARRVRCPSSSHLRDDSRLHLFRPDERHGTSGRPPCQGATRALAKTAPLPWWFPRATLGFAPRCGEPARRLETLYVCSAVQDASDVTSTSKSVEADRDLLRQ
jgi:hypothetical protein